MTNHNDDQARARAAEWLTRFCKANAAQWRATERDEDDITADALAVYDQWTGTSIPFDLPRLLLHAFAAAANALEVDPDAVDTETREVVWALATLATKYAEKATVDELEQWLRAEGTTNEHDRPRSR